MSKTNIIIAGVLVVVTLIMVVVFFGFGLKPPKPEEAIIEFWGIEKEEVWRDLISKFKEKYPHIMLNYKTIDLDLYEENLINRLAENRGPDVFMLKNSWIIKHKDKIFPLPQDYFDFSTTKFKKTFVDDTSSKLITNEGEILGLPLFVDTLVLFYNKDMFNNAGIAEAPRNWDEVTEISKRLTTKTTAGDIIKSGLAVGTFQNVANALEILSSIILQQGDAIINTEGQVSITQRSAEAIRFYTSFADQTQKTYSWSGRFENSITALAEENAAMAFGFTEDIDRIRKRNPHINLGIAPFPQLKNTSIQTTYGKYFFPTVSKLSPHKGPAWQFVLFAASKEAADIYTQNTKLAPSRRDLISVGTKSEELDVFYRKALIARSWTIPDENAVSKIFKDAVDSTASRAITSQQAASRITEQLQLLLR